MTKQQSRQELEEELISHKKSEALLWGSAIALILASGLIFLFLIDNNRLQSENSALKDSQEVSFNQWVKECNNQGGEWGHEYYVNIPFEKCHDSEFCMFPNGTKINSYCEVLK